MAGKAFDPITPWFHAAEQLGEYIGIRFGRIAPGTETPEWIFLRHTDFDGIGGFASLLRERGAVLKRLAQIKHPSNPSRWPLVRALPKLLTSRRQLKWTQLTGKPGISTSATAPSAVAWHVFDERTTRQIRQVCRKGGVTVNSFLIKHLTKAVRPFLQDESAVMAWMIPVNLRGKIVRESDTANYSSYVGIRVRSYETVQDIHKSIYRALGRGEHWANWYAYETGRLLGQGMKRYLVDSGRALPDSFVGGFSNLGDWDPEKKITANGCAGSWLFSPPVLRCQKIGAGCVTFQNQLSLTIQAHPELTVAEADAQRWMQYWVKEIELDLSSKIADAD